MIPTLALAQVGRGGRAATPNTFAFVSALLHMEGSDGSTTFTDSSGSPKTFTAAGNAQLDTAQKPFDGSSGLFDGTGDYISCPHDVSLAVPTGSFTVETFFRVNGGLGGQMILCAKATNAGESPYYLFITTGSKIGFSGFNQASGFAYQLTGTTTLVTGTWYFAAGVRDGNDFRIYLGTLGGNASQEAAANSSASLRNVTDPFVAGGFNNSTQGFNGWMKELRFTKGVCHYPGGTAFAVPSAAFPNS